MLALALFVGLPILEILLLIQAGAAMGFWWTVGWIFCSALIGVFLMRQQGMAVVRQAQMAQDAGEVPVGAILNGIRLTFAGICMIVPGFITDALGLLLLLPWSGEPLGRVMSGRVHMHANWMGSSRAYHRNDPNAPSSAQTVDADFEVVNPGGSTPPARTRSGDAQPPATKGRNPWDSSA